jgi:hypothetical protein
MVEHCCARTENCRPAFQTGDQISAPGGYVGGDPISLFRIRSSAANDAQRLYSTGSTQTQTAGRYQDPRLSNR